MMAFQAFYNGQKKLFLQNCYELFRLSPPEDNTLKHHTYGTEVQIWVYARYHFVHLLYLYFSEHLNAQTLENKLQCISDELQKINDVNIAVTLAFLFEALWFTGHTHQILYFSDTYFHLVSNMQQTSKLEGENLKALGAMILFYQQAASKLSQNIDNKHAEKSVKVIEKACQIPSFKPFEHTYQVYLNEFYGLMTTNPEKKAAFFAQAKQHACTMKNKYFMQQIDRIKRGG
jgi:hypothetical protein